MICSLLSAGSLMFARCQLPDWATTNRYIALRHLLPDAGARGYAGCDRETVFAGTAAAPQ